MYVCECVCIEMGIQLCMWRQQHGPHVNKSCINSTLNRATSGLFIWPNLHLTARGTTGFTLAFCHSTLNLLKVTVPVKKRGVSPHKLLGRCVTIRVQRFNQQHVCGSGVICHILIWPCFYGAKVGHEAGRSVKQVLKNLDLALKAFQRTNSTNTIKG